MSFCSTKMAGHRQRQQRQTRAAARRGAWTGSPGSTSYSRGIELGCGRRLHVMVSSQRLVGGPLNIPDFFQLLEDCLETTRNDIEGLFFFFTVLSLKNSYSSLSADSIAASTGKTYQSPCPLGWSLHYSGPLKSVSAAKMQPGRTLQTLIR